MGNKKEDKVANNKGYFRKDFSFVLLPCACASGRHMRATLQVIGRHGQVDIKAGRRIKALCALETDSAAPLPPA